MPLDQNRWHEARAFIDSGRWHEAAPGHRTRAIASGVVQLEACGPATRSCAGRRGTVPAIGQRAVISSRPSVSQVSRGLSTTKLHGALRPLGPEAVDDYSRVLRRAEAATASRPTSTLPSTLGRRPSCTRAGRFEDAVASARSGGRCPRRGRYAVGCLLSCDGALSARPGGTGPGLAPARYRRPHDEAPGQSETRQFVNLHARTRGPRARGGFVDQPGRPLIPARAVLSQRVLAALRRAGNTSGRHDGPACRPRPVRRPLAARPDLTPHP